MGSVLGWVVAAAPDRGFDPRKVVARGISTGGGYAFRVAHTHAGRLFAAIAQAGGYHHMFDTAWIGAQDQMEDLIARAGRGHMGNPGAEDNLYQWIDDAVAGKP